MQAGNVIHYNSMSSYLLFLTLFILTIIFMSLLDTSKDLLLHIKLHTSVRSVFIIFYAVSSLGSLNPLNQV